jgi:(p)ppGpp synthase/HD superfamily hydrolase
MVGENPGLDKISVERERRLKALKSTDKHAISLWNSALKLPAERGSKARLLSAYKFARNLPYAHDGLSGEVYVSHPIRVAAMSLLSQKTLDWQIGVIGLLHNVLEVSHLSSKEIESSFGKNLVDQLLSLKVEREHQWDPTYKKVYYSILEKGPRSSRIVKIFDKLDNLFMLCLNPDASIRNLYLSEVETFLLPIVERDLPAYLCYFEALVKDCRSVGYLDELTK